MKSIIDKTEETILEGHQEIVDRKKKKKKRQKISGESCKHGNV